MRRGTECQAQRGVVILPGLGNNSEDYDPLAKAIRERGLLVDTAKIARLDWGRNAAGLLDLSYYRGTLQPRPVVDWCSPPSHMPCFVSVSKTALRLRPALMVNGYEGCLCMRLHR